MRHQIIQLILEYLLGVVKKTISDIIQNLVTLLIFVKLNATAYAEDILSIAHDWPNGLEISVCDLFVNFMIFKVILILRYFLQ